MRQLESAILCLACVAKWIGKAKQSPIFAYGNRHWKAAKLMAVGYTSCILSRIMSSLQKICVGRVPSKVCPRLRSSWVQHLATVAAGLQERLQRHRFPEMPHQCHSAAGLELVFEEALV